MITGAAGQLGRCLAARAVTVDRRVRGYSSTRWDIADPATTPVLSADDVVINCAAYTNVDAAESDEQRAFRVNATGAGNVARACADAGARLIHISTDYVFDGDFGAAAVRPYEPGDVVGPLNAYGRSKLAGERAVLAALPSAAVVRTSWLYTGDSGHDFVAVMARKAAAGEPVEVVDDQIGSPTYVADLADALLQLVDGDRIAGLWHAANAGAVSRFEQARAVFGAVGADPELVRPVGSDRMPRPARRPPYSALGSRAWAAAGLAPLRSWSVALADAVAMAGNIG